MSRFRGKLLKMIRDAGSKFDDYSFSHKIRQIFCIGVMTLCHAIGQQMLPILNLPREAEDFPRGDRHFKNVPPLTYLIYSSPKEIY